MSNPDGFFIDPSYKEWLADQGITDIVYDPSALQTFAEKLGVSIDDDPRVTLGFPLLPSGVISSPDQIYVGWAPHQEVSAPDRQKHLTEVVGDTLLYMADRARRRLVYGWGIGTIVGGAVVSAVGERFFESELARRDGLAAMIIGTAVMSLVILQRTPATPSVEGVEPPLELHQNDLSM